ncbi:DUF4126 family protein [Lysobacter sp. F6437]|uniref:DUF4126 family protein n=1 Tax=Lysobacter sp. F6437 TaxID=3459296 RepID=UPI00403D97A7
MALVHSVLMAAIGGMRAVTPLAAVANAARDGLLPRDNGAPRWLSSRAVSAATGALALAEMAGDKMKSAPDRIALPGLLARCATGAIAGVALAPARQRNAAALLGAAAAIGSSYVTFRMRKYALQRYGQTPTGVVEDGISAAGAALVVAGVGRAARTGARLT